MYSEPAFQQQFMLAEAADEIGQPIVRRSQFDLALFILIKHLRIPDLYINLLPNKYRSDLLGFQNLIIFIDELGLIRVYSAESMACIEVNYEFLIKNASQSKILVPYNKGNDFFALKLNLYYHLKYKCCGLTYLMQIMSENFYCKNHRKRLLLHLTYGILSQETNK